MFLNLYKAGFSSRRLFPSSKTSLLGNSQDSSSNSSGPGLLFQPAQQGGTVHGPLLPVWVVAIVILRDLVILSGGIAYHFLIGNYEMAPTIISKVNTFMQIALGLFVVVSAAFLSLPPWVLTSLVWIVAATSILSGVHYVWSWGVRAKRNWPTRGA